MSVTGSKSKVAPYNLAQNWSSFLPSADNIVPENIAHFYLLYDMTASHATYFRNFEDLRRHLLQTYGVNADVTYCQQWNLKRPVCISDTVWVLGLANGSLWKSGGGLEAYVIQEHRYSFDRHVDSPEDRFRIVHSPTLLMIARYLGVDLKRVSGWLNKRDGNSTWSQDMNGHVRQDSIQRTTIDEMLISVAGTAETTLALPAGPCDITPETYWSDPRPSTDPYYLKFSKKWNYKPAPKQGVKLR